MAFLLGVIARWYRMQPAPGGRYRKEATAALWPL
jgi:hypothetical protein